MAFYHLYYCLFVILILNNNIDFQVCAKHYDYTYTAECLAKPLSPQYNGGVVVNPELNEGLKGWGRCGNEKIKLAEAKDGNKYIVATAGNLSFQSFSQKFHLHKDKLYTFSAWLQVNSGSADISAVFKTGNTKIIAGWVVAKEGCWSMLKGGLVVNASAPALLYFESNNSVVEIMADSISLQPFTQKQWKSHQDRSIENARKTKVKIEVVDQHRRPVPNATVSINLLQSRFPFGCAINQNILQNTAYQNWFTSRFKYTVFEDEFKWYSNERTPGVEDYAASDALVNFAKSRGISIRGNNVFWDDPIYQPSWVAGLSIPDFWAATNRRMSSVMGRYRGQLFQWDVLNEILHHNFFQSRLGPFHRDFLLKANQVDPQTTPFLNEFNTIEDSRGRASFPSKYLAMIFWLRKNGYNGPLGIGLEGHFSISPPNLAYIRSAIDMLASAKLPIWITELDMRGSNQAADLDRILREIHSHAAVQGIMIWSAWSPQGCYAMCLTDNNFRNLPTGDVVDRFMNSLAPKHSNAVTDSNGIFEISLFHGDYHVNITHPNGDLFSDTKFITLAPDQVETVYRLEINDVINS